MKPPQRSGSLMICISLVVLSLKRECRLFSWCLVPSWLGLLVRVGEKKKEEEEEEETETERSQE